MEPGWIKVIAATLVAVLGLVGFNLAVWRRMRVAVARAKADEDASGPA